jgi:glycosyltransferase involved in cell wall biosynthesis
MIERSNIPVSGIYVIFVVSKLEPSGPIIQLAYLLANLDRSRITPFILETTGSTDDNAVKELIKDLGINSASLNGGKISSLVRAPKFLAKTARRHSNVIIHSYGFRNDIITWLSRVTPRIANVHNNLQYNFQRMFGNIYGYLLARISLFLLSRASVVVSCGDEVKFNLRSLGQESLTIRNSLDMHIYQRLLGTSSTLKKNNNSLPTYITVSSKIPGKNIEFLLEAFSNLQNRHRKLIVIGYVDPKLVKSFDGYHNIDFRGHVPKPGVAFLDADFFVSASQHEGLPNAALEALALGLPVILSNIPAHRELLSVVGNDVGSMFESNFLSFMNSLAHVERLDYFKVSEKCKLHVEQHFCAKKMSKRYEILYEKIVFNK